MAVSPIPRGTRTALTSGCDLGNGSSRQHFLFKQVFCGYLLSAPRLTNQGSTVAHTLLQSDLCALQGPVWPFAEVLLVPATDLTHQRRTFLILTTTLKLDSV